MNLVVINVKNLVILQRIDFRYFRTNKSEQIISCLINVALVRRKFFGQLTDHL